MLDINISVPMTFEKRMYIKELAARRGVTLANMTRTLIDAGLAAIQTKEMNKA